MATPGEVAADDHVAFEVVGHSVEVRANAIVRGALDDPDVVALLAQRGGSGAVGADEIPRKDVAGGPGTLDPDTAPPLPEIRLPSFASSVPSPLVPMMLDDGRVVEMDAGAALPATTVPVASVPR